MTLCLLLLGTAPAFGGRAADMASAQQLRESGEASLAAGRFESAIEQLQASYDIDPMSLLLFKLGQAHLKLKQARQALAFFKRYDDAELGWPAIGAKALAEARAEAEALLKPPPVLVPPPHQVERKALAPPPRGPVRRPVYKTAWFWGVLAVATACAATGVALAISRPWELSDVGPIYDLPGSR